LKPVAGRFLLEERPPYLPSSARRLHASNTLTAHLVRLRPRTPPSWLGILLPQDPTQALPPLGPGTTSTHPSCFFPFDSQRPGSSCRPPPSVQREAVPRSLQGGNEGLVPLTAHTSTPFLWFVSTGSVYSRAALRLLRYHGRYVLFLQPAGCRQIPRVFLEALSEESFPASRQDGAARLYGPLGGACLSQQLFASVLSSPGPCRLRRG
jgi:hypothetical protein